MNNKGTAVVKRVLYVCEKFWNKPCRFFINSGNPDGKRISCMDNHIPRLCMNKEAWENAYEEILPTFLP